MATLVIRNPDGSEQEHEVTAQLTIGRAEGNDLVLAEGGVSRNHARFFLEGAELKVEDVGSSNGTWVDGQRLTGPVTLGPTSQVTLGDYEVRVKVSPQPLPRARSAPGSKEPTNAVGGPRAPGVRSTRVVGTSKPASAPGAALARRPATGRLGGPQLRGLVGPLTGQSFPLAGTMTVGRVAGTDLTFEDDSVSRKHAELEVRGREVIVRDLGSANGTTVNGVPITADTVLNDGDIVQFGVVELAVDLPGSSAGQRAVVRAGSPRASALARPGPGGDARHPPPAADEPGLPGSPGRRRLLIGGGVVVGLLVVAVLARALTAPPDPVDMDARPMSGRLAGAAAASQAPSGPAGEPHDVATSQDIDELLTECRTYSSPELRTPDWRRARAACERILDLEPIHPDAAAMLKRIEIERQCQENLEKGRELAITGQLEGALEALAKVGAREGECPFYGLRALDEARDPVAEVKRLAARDCKDYASNAKWENALKRCELYMRLACQMMEDKDLYPPALSRLKLVGPLGQYDWRPADPLYVNYLKARERLKPGEPPWRCPPIPAFRPPPPPPDLTKPAKDEFMKRFASPDMGKALVLYFDGRNEAALPLQRIRENMNRAAEHDQAKALLDDISMAQNLLANGLTEVTNEKPERAEVPFRKALELDEKLVLGDARTSMDEATRRRELDRRTSVLRRTIVETMASTCYARGKTLMDRQDARQACRLWKLGASFSRSNIDLLKALTNQCTRRAAEALPRAEGCAQLKAVLDYAVEGDRIRQQVEARMAEEGCEGN